ncbi:Crp/Fnr family transcriptional regulator [Bradyrhizobium canariense]|uniref:Crp/Fnr family transcriptional regulator n=1 Tax=Bradyrhizobium canariense TaxID=255045 RepID=UPI001C66D635|nr:Crp/Fnr family transcriptional regulator [Bradyrhizobium canariense]MBW5435722.1 Crp/Fnr family transcriptional regulator [Bradyrhizobium canariense]
MSKKATATWRMTDALAAKLLSFEGKVRVRRFAEGEQLYRQDDVSTCFYFVKSGLVQVSIFRRDGTEVVLENMGPNALCGEGAAFDGLPRFSTAVAIEPTEALEFDTARIEPLLRADPELALAMLRLTSLKQRILALRLEHLVSNDPEDRILELLRRLSQMFAIDHERGRKIITHLTHEQIASMTGTSRVTVTRTMGRLREKGMLSSEDGFTILANNAET